MTEATVKLETKERKHRDDTKHQTVEKQKDIVACHHILGRG